MSLDRGDCGLLRAHETNHVSFPVLPVVSDHYEYPVLLCSPLFVDVSPLIQVYATRSSARTPPFVRAPITPSKEDTVRAPSSCPGPTEAKGGSAHSGPKDDEHV
jgi:hypothetical protein